MIIHKQIAIGIKPNSKCFKTRPPPIPIFTYYRLVKTTLCTYLSKQQIYLLLGRINLRNHDIMVAEFVFIIFRVIKAFPKQRKYI